MATKDFYLYVYSFRGLRRLNLSKLRDGDCQFEMLIGDFRELDYPLGMALLSVNSKLYMFGGVIGYTPNRIPFLGAYLVERTDEQTLLVSDESFPKLSSPKIFPPVVVKIEEKTYVFDNPWHIEGGSFEVFDPSTLIWKLMEDPPLFYKKLGDTPLSYFAWGHKILIQNVAGSSVFDTKTEIWEDGDSFVERFVKADAPLPTGTAAKIEEGLYIAMSRDQDAVVVYEFDPNDGLLRNHQVLGDFSDLFSRERIEGYGRGYVTSFGDGQFCFLLCGTTFGGGTPVGKYAARMAAFQVSSSVPSRLPVHLKCLECFDVKGDWEISIESMLVMPDWSKKRAAEYTESDALLKKSESMVPK